MGHGMAFCRLFTKLCKQSFSEFYFVSTLNLYFKVLNYQNLKISKFEQLLSLVMPNFWGCI